MCSRQDRRVTGSVAPRGDPPFLLSEGSPLLAHLCVRNQIIYLSGEGVTLGTAEAAVLTTGIRDLCQSLNAISVGIRRAVKVRATQPGGMLARRAPL